MPVFVPTDDFWTSVLASVFWVSEALIILLVMAPVTRFILLGWKVRKQEVTNRLSKTTKTYLDRFWPEESAKARNLAGNAARRPGDPDPDQTIFSMIYDRMAGRTLYLFPAFLLFVAIFIFGGFAVETGLRAGYEQYVLSYQHYDSSEHLIGKISRLSLARIDAAFAPFPPIVLTLPTLASVAGAYLFVTQIVIRGYLTRTLLMSDLLWSSFRLVIAIPLGMSVAVVGSDYAFPLIGFALGAFPMSAVISLLRRLAAARLSQAEQDNKDELLKLSGVTNDVSDRLKDAGVVSPPQLADTDPVSLSLRSGLPFDFVINLAAQGQVWSYIGATAASLAPYGYGDARAIARLMADAKARNACLQALSKKCLVDKSNFDVCLLEDRFKAIAADDYTHFLLTISAPKA